MTELELDMNEFDLIETDDAGLDLEDTSSDNITEPFDPTLIRVSTAPFTADNLIARLRHEEIELAPGFQRKGGIWNDKAQSRLIESMLIKIPLPAFYMDATEEDKWVVVDGLQRLTTLKRFVISQDLKLKELEFLGQLHDKTYEELPRNYQRRILETQVTVYLIEKGTPSEVKFNIFKRINTGGLPLSAQEIRHALNQGPVINFLQSLAQSNAFRTATNKSVHTDRMADRECVLRFLAFVLTPYDQYRAKDFDSFLSDTMKAINKMNLMQREHLEARFLRSMQAASDIFGTQAFRKYSPSRLLPVNKPLFETWSVNLDALTDFELLSLIERKSSVLEKNARITDDNEFQDAISFGTGDIGKVRTRFSRIKQLIREVLP